MPFLSDEGLSGNCERNIATRVEAIAIRFLVPIQVELFCASLPLQWPRPFSLPPGGSSPIHKALGASPGPNHRWRYLGWRTSQLMQLQHLGFSLRTPA